MKIAKKLLCTVLSLCMITSTIVLPVSVQAADGDIIANFTFNDGETTDAFGINGEYNIVPGYAESNQVAVADAREKVAYIKGSATTTDEKGYFNKASLGDNITGVKHATLQFDYWISNAGEEFMISPASDDRLGIYLKRESSINYNAHGISFAVDGKATSTLKDENGKAFGFNRYEWHELAIEYNMNTGDATIYLDGKVAGTKEGLTVDGDVPADFSIWTNATTNGVYLDNLYYYEGAYGSVSVNKPEPKSDDIWLDFTLDEDLKGLNATTSGTKINGFAGKASTDKVNKLPGEWIPFTNQVATTDSYTYEASVFVGENGAVTLHSWNTGNATARAGIKLSAGKVYISADNNTSSTTSTETTYTYLKNTWNKLAMTRTTTGWIFYVNGVQVGTSTHAGTGSISKRFGFTGVSGNIYVDNVRLYKGAYTPDTAITDPEQANDGVITVKEGTDVATVEGYVTDGDTAELYQSDLTIPSTTVADGDVLIVNKGELYKAYTIKVKSRYAPGDVDSSRMLYEYSFDAGSAAQTSGSVSVGALKVTGSTTGIMTYEDSIGGKFASDKVLKVTRDDSEDTLDLRHPWAADLTMDIDAATLTEELQLYVPVHDAANGATFSWSTYTNTGNDGTGIKSSYSLSKDGIFSIGVVDCNAVVDGIYTVALSAGEWHNLAVTITKATSGESADGTMKLYLDGALVKTVTGLQINSFQKGTRLGFGTSADASAVQYVDNLRAYTGEYVSWNGEVATPEPTETPTPTPTPVPTPTPTPVPTPTPTPVPTATPVVTEEPTEEPAPTETPFKIRNAFYFNEDAAEPWEYDGGTVYVKSGEELVESGVRNDIGKIVDGNVARKVKTDKIWEVTGGTVTGVLDANGKSLSGVYFTGGKWNGQDTKVTKATLKFDVYNTNSYNRFAIWAPTITGKTQMLFGIAARNATVETSTVGLGVGGSVPANPCKTAAPVNEWVEYAMTIDTAAGTVTLYMNGEVIETMDITGWEGIPTGFAIAVAGAKDGTPEDGEEQKYHKFYMDNVVYYEGAYTSLEAPEAPAADVDFTVHATGEPYTRDGVEYVFVAVTSDIISDISLYDMFVCTDGTTDENGKEIVKGIKISNLARTTVTGAAELGVLVLNVPYANKDNFRAKLTLAE